MTANQQNRKDELDNGYISTGSPESAPIPMESSQESAPREEFGYEQLQRLEAQSETAHEVAERKEAEMVENRNKNQSQPRPVSKKKKNNKPPAANVPSYFGYSIPQNISTNYKDISKKKGKGDPNESKTWIYMLLDRILKMKNVN